MATTIDLSFFDNEDVARKFTLKYGDPTNPTPFDLTSSDLRMDVVDSRTGTRVVRLTSNETDARITKDDAVNGVFTLHFTSGLIPYKSNQKLSYDILLVTSGSPQRLWGGAVNVSKGSTQATVS